MPAATLGFATGVVATFDADRGLGTVEADTTTYPFHCTAMADGSRSIDPATRVRFDVIAGRMGRWEAWNIEQA